MADNKTKRGPRDRSRINLKEDYELRYWSKKLGITQAELKQAAKKAGSSSVKAVQRELSTARH